MTRLLLAILASLSLLLTTTVSDAQRRERREERRDDRRDAIVESTTDWNRLGERRVSAGVDHDTILVTASEGTFTRVMLRVEHSALELFDITITFGDGTTWSPGTRLVFAEDTVSRVIDLPGGARVIRRVDFHYANLPGGGHAQLELWAR